MNEARNELPGAMGLDTQGAGPNDVEPKLDSRSDDGSASSSSAPVRVAAPVPLRITAEMLTTPEPLEQRIDFERGISHLPRLTLFLIVANVAVFVWELASGALASQSSIIAAGALWRADVMRGQVWRIFSSMFLHGGVGHLFGNMVALYVLGLACEHAFGSLKTGLIYLISGICGALLSLAFTAGPSVGASGAIFGLSAAVTVFLWRYQRLFFIRDKRIGFVLLVWAAYTVGTGFLSPEIDNFCHIGGFVGGALTGRSCRADDDRSWSRDLPSSPLVWSPDLRLLFPGHDLAPATARICSDL